MNLSKLPLVSIITPSFNQCAYLEESILSVLKQDYPNIEYIIVDGGSSDESIHIIKNYENRLAWWVSEPDKGQSHAIIKGLNKSKGKYITWLCSDDILEPSAVSISVGFLEKYNTVSLTFGNRTRIDCKGNITACIRKGSFKKVYLKGGLTLPQETVMIRKSMYDKTTGINQSLQMAMDYDLWCKLIQTGTFLHIPAFLGRFRTHAENKSTLYSKELKNSGFTHGRPAEHSALMMHYFKIKPSKLRKKIFSILYTISNLVERRTKEYKRKLKMVEKIKSDLGEK